MEVLEFNELNPVTFKMRIRVDAESLRQAFEEVLADFAKDANIPGFRPRKVPKKILERHIGTEAIWRIARDRASHDAFVQALEIKRKSSLTEPEYEHSEYTGEGSYEYSVVFHPEPPSPEEILRGAITPRSNAAYPEDHLPEGFGEQGGISPDAHPESWEHLDHGHAISGGLAGVQPLQGVPAVGGIPGVGIDKPVSENPEIVPGIEHLPGSPQMHPRLPGNIARMIRHPEGMTTLPNEVELPTPGTPRDSAEVPAKEPDRHEPSPPFKISEDGEQE